MMATSQDFHVQMCHKEIVKYDLEIKALIQDIRECSGPLSVLTDLNAQVKEKFHLLRLRIQDLEQMAREQDKESDKQALLKEMECHKRQMLSNQTVWRKSNLSCKQTIDNSEKDELLEGGDPTRQRCRVFLIQCIGVQNIPLPAAIGFVVSNDSLLVHYYNILMYTE
ncbi:vesicle transport SEC20 [Pelobates cultripes]|uniref:Vesicle transport SEC20 n=1 Tax=Pelobates cultripes TaxID=61616 RepID=A0AAD1RS11_PELCU|nr:vesicle transport SEC20 [Pelobates cultripes]